MKVNHNYYILKAKRMGYEKHFKEYEELCFTDDYMFCMILTTRLDLCKELLELILDIKIRKVEIAEQQKNVDITYDGKGVRFDVYVDDAENTVYDIEMQTTRQKDLPKRTRYYQGMIDLNLIQKGMRYSELKKSYVIFICLEDVFGKNLPVYTFNYICEQDYSVRLGDEATKVIVNAAGSRNGLSEDMCSFLDFLSKKETNSNFTKELQGAVNESIAKKKWKVEYMTIMEKIREEREDAAIKTTIITLKRLNFPDNVIIDNIIKNCSLTEEEAKEALLNYEKE